MNLTEESANGNSGNAAAGVSVTIGTSENSSGTHEASSLSFLVESDKAKDIHPPRDGGG